MKVKLLEVADLIFTSLSTSSQTEYYMVREESISPVTGLVDITKATQSTNNFSDRLILKPKDLVLFRSGLVGFISSVPEDKKLVPLSRMIIRCKPDAPISPELLFVQLNRPWVTSFLLRANDRAFMFPRELIEKIEIEIPSIEPEKVEALRELWNQTNELYENCKTRKHLTDSLILGYIQKTSALAAPEPETN